MNRNRGPACSGIPARHQPEYALCRTLTHFAVVRGLFGLSEGGVINPVYKLMNHWVLPAERGFANGVQTCFGYLGLVIGTPIIAALIGAQGWRAMFFATGAATLIGMFIFWLLVHDHPREHPWISAEERDRIESVLARDRVTYDPGRGATAALSFLQGLRRLGHAGLLAHLLQLLFRRGRRQQRPVRRHRRSRHHGVVIRSHGLVLDGLHGDGRGHGRVGDTHRLRARA